MRFLKRTGHVCLAVAVVAALLAAGAWQLHRYIASRKVARQVAARLEAALGVPVNVGRVDAGVGSSSLEDVELFEPGADKSAKPWAVIRRAEVDLSSLDLVEGKTVPHGITLHGVTFTLRYDQLGQPLTRLPQPRTVIESIPQPAPRQQAPRRELPQVHIEDARLVYEQPGHADLVITGISGDVHTEDGEPVLSGTVHDPNWGDWVLGGRMSPDSKACSASLRSVRPVPIKRTALNQIPFADPALWDQIEVHGETPAEIAFRYDPATQTVAYHATFEPTAMSLCVSAYDLRMEQVRGKITLENNVIHLDGLHGRVAGGDIEGHGDLAFDNTRLKLAVAVDVCGLETSRLPKAWGLQSEISGRLGGHADLRTTIRDGRAVFRGEGKGVINDARVALVPAEPIPVTMEADPRGFHFVLGPPKLNPLQK